MTAAPARSIALSLNCDGRHGLALLLLCAVLLAPLPWQDVLLPLLRWQRGAFGAGEPWRLLTGHLVHLDAAHAVLNVAGLVLLWALFARSLGPAGWLTATATSIAAIDAGFALLRPGIEWYVGASGALHGVLAAGAVGMLRGRDPLAWPTVLLFAAKLAWEQWQGALPFADGSAVVVDAHLFGAVGGLAAAAIPKRRGEPL